METVKLLDEIKRLPVSEQMFIAESIIKNARKNKLIEQMSYAAEELYDEYFNNKELTAFTDIDFDNFYETAE